MVPEFVDRMRGSKWMQALPAGSRWNRALPGGSKCVQAQPALKEKCNEDCDV